MIASFRDLSNVEQVTMRCSVLQDNSMQCSHKPVKRVKTDNIPDNIINHNGKAFVLCQAHFNIYKELNQNEIEFVDEDLPRKELTHNEKPGTGKGI